MHKHTCVSKRTNIRRHTCAAKVPWIVWDEENEKFFSIVNAIQTAVLAEQLWEVLGLAVNKNSLFRREILDFPDMDLESRAVVIIIVLVFETHKFQDEINHVVW